MTEQLAHGGFPGVPQRVFDDYGVRRAACVAHSRRVLKDHVKAWLRGVDVPICDCCGMVWPCDAVRLAAACAAVLQ